MLKFERSVISVVARRFRSRAVVELENLSVSVAPRCSPEREGAEPFRARSPSQVVAKLLLEVRLPLPCRRAIAFTETLAASAIPPLDKTRSQVIAPAIAANQLVRFRLTAHLLPERPCRL